MKTGSMINPRKTHGGNRYIVPIKTIPRRRPYFAPGMLAALRESIRAEAVFPGREAAALDAALAEKLDVQSPVVVASGRIGLRLLLETSGLSAGAEVLVPGYTFGLLYQAIKASGFVPVPVDIDQHSFQMDPSKAEAAVSDRTGAILATHLFGEPCEIESFVKIAEKHKLLLIEDCAQALGARRGNVRVGSFGDAAISSFDLSKPLHGIRGGLVFGRNKRWISRVRERLEEKPASGVAPTAEILKRYAETLLVGSPFWRAPMMLFSYKCTKDKLVKIYRKSESSESAQGMKTDIDEARLPGSFARMIRENLESFDLRLEQRRRIRAMYNDMLGDILSFQSASSADGGSCHLVVAMINADVIMLRRFLALRGIDIAVGEEIADDCIIEKGSATNTVFKSAISLPIYCGLGDGDVRRVSEYIRAGYNKYR